jgi:hypothetical protein
MSKQLLAVLAILGLTGVQLPTVHAQFPDDLNTITIETRFIRQNDNFFQRIGVDLEIDRDLADPTSETVAGFTVLSNQRDAPIDISPVEMQSRIPSVPLNPSGDPEFKAELGVRAGLSNSNGSRAAPPRPPATSLPNQIGFQTQMGITAAPNVGARIQSQGVVALELDTPDEAVDFLEFELHATFDANIVAPTDGGFQLGAFFELSPNLEDFRFSGPDQRFFYDSESLGPFGSLFSSSTDFENVAGVLQFRGDSVIPFSVAVDDIVGNELFFQTYSDIQITNSGSSLAQIDAFNTVTYTLSSTTPGVGIQISTVVPEPAIPWLVALPGIFGSTRRRRRAAATGAAMSFCL